MIREKCKFNFACTPVEGVGGIFHQHSGEKGLLHVQAFDATVSSLCLHDQAAFILLSRCSGFLKCRHFMWLEWKWRLVTLTQISICKELALGLVFSANTNLCLVFKGQFRLILTHKNAATPQKASTKVLFPESDVRWNPFEGGLQHDSGFGWKQTSELFPVACFLLILSIESLAVFNLQFIEMPKGDGAWIVSSLKNCGENFNKFHVYDLWWTKFDTFSFFALFCPHLSGTMVQNRKKNDIPSVISLFCSKSKAMFRYRKTQVQDLGNRMWS